MPKALKNALGYEGQILFAEHHQSPRGVGLLPIAVRGGRDPHARRRGRVGDVDLGRGPRQLARAAARDPLPALAGPALQRLHLLPGLQGEQRRVQGHGRGALRAAEVRGPDQAPLHRRARRRLVQARHEVLRVRLRPHHDERALRAGDGPAATRPRVEDGRLPLGRRGEHPEGHRRGRAGDGARPAREDRHEERRAGGRRRAQLCRERAPHAQRPVRGRVDPACGRRRRRRARRGAVRRALRAEAPAPVQDGPRVLGPELQRRGHPQVPREARRALPDAPARADAEGDGARPRRGAGRDRLVPGPHGMGPALARRALDHRRLAQPRELAAREPEDQVPRELPSIRARLPRREGRATGSTSTARAPTCCWCVR